MRNNKNAHTGSIASARLSLNTALICVIYTHMDGCGVCVLITLRLT